MLNKILGGLYGQALGDAWGMPALLTPEATWEYFGGWIEDFKPAPENHPVHAGLPAGRVTDDTEQAFALAQVILTEGRMSAEGAARALIAWYERIGGDRSPYVGPSTRRAIQALRRGEDLYQVGRFGDTNGAAMRVSPVGLIHPGDPKGAIADAYLSCIPTHHTNVAVSGAAAVAAAIAVAMRPGTTLEEIINAAKDAAMVGLKMGHQWMGASIARRIDLALEIVRAADDERQRLQSLYDVVGAGLAITEAVPAAFGVLALAEGDIHRTAVFGAALSGDADTVTAIACAIAGAWQGIEAFEPSWLEQLRMANPELDFEGVAEGLYQLVHH